ncbi:MAG: MarR family transcriptional regulator [Hyphomonadaceae bacterium]
MPDDPRAEADAALIALRQIVKAVESSSRRLAKESRLTPSQLNVLRALASRGEMMSSDIARAVGLKLATVSVLLDRLQEAGLAAKRRHETDRRGVWVSLTEAGHEALREAPDALQDTFRDRFARLKDWERAQMHASLLRIVALMDAEEIDAAPVLDIGKVTELPES